MFSITQPAPNVGPAPAPIMNPYTDVLKLSDPYGSNVGFLEQKSPLDNAEDELKRLQEEIYNPKNTFREDPYREITPLDKFRRGYSALGESWEVQDYMQPKVAERPVPNEYESTKALEDKLASKFKKAYEAKLQHTFLESRVFTAKQGL